MKDSEFATLLAKLASQIVDSPRALGQVEPSVATRPDESDVGGSNSPSLQVLLAEIRANGGVRLSPESAIEKPKLPLLVSVLSWFVILTLLGTALPLYLVRQSILNAERDLASIQSRTAVYEVNESALKERLGRLEAIAIERENDATYLLDYLASISSEVDAAWLELGYVKASRFNMAESISTLMTEFHTRRVSLENIPILLMSDIESKILDLAQNSLTAVAVGQRFESAGGLLEIARLTRATVSDTALANGAGHETSKDQFRRSVFGDAVDSIESAALVFGASVAFFWAGQDGKWKHREMRDALCAVVEFLHSGACQSEKGRPGSEWLVSELFSISSARNSVDPPSQFKERYEFASLVLSEVCIRRQIGCSGLPDGPDGLQSIQTGVLARLGSPGFGFRYSELLMCSVFSRFYLQERCINGSPKLETGGERWMKAYLEFTDEIGFRPPVVDGALPDGDPGTVRRSAFLCSGCLCERFPDLCVEKILGIGEALDKRGADRKDELHRLIVSDVKLLLARAGGIMRRRGLDADTAVEKFRKRLSTLERSTTGGKRLAPR